MPVYHNITYLGCVEWTDRAGPVTTLPCYPAICLATLVAHYHRYEIAGCWPGLATGSCPGQAFNSGELLGRQYLQFTCLPIIKEHCRAYGSVMAY